MNTDYKSRIERLIRNSKLSKQKKDSYYEMLAKIRSVRERNECTIQDYMFFRKMIIVECEEQIRKRAYGQRKD